MPAMILSSFFCALVSLLPNISFLTRSPFPLLSAHTNSYAVARDQATARRRITARAREARDKERQLNALKANVQAHEASMRHTSFMALQDRILLWNQIWKLEKELKTLRNSSITNGRKRQVVVEGGISSRSSSSASTSRVITGRSEDGSRVSWRAMLSIVMNPSDSTSNLDLSESADDLVDEIAQVIQSRGTCIGEARRKQLASIVEESYASSSSMSSAASDSGSSESEDGSDGTAVESPPPIHTKLPAPIVLCHDDHKLFSPTHTSPNHPDSMYDWIADQSQRETEDWSKDVIFEPTPGVPQFSSWHDLLSVHSI